MIKGVKEMCSIENIIDDTMSYLKDDKGKQANLCWELLDDAIWNYVIDYKHNGITKNIAFCYSLKSKLYSNRIRKQVYDIMRFEVAKQVERYYKRFDVDYNYITKPISVASRIAVLIIIAIMYGSNKAVEV